MYWHFRLRTCVGFRVPSRILQVLETQLLPPLVFHAERSRDSERIEFVIAGTQEQARRVGALLLRLPSVDSAVWCGNTIPVTQAEMMRLAVALRAEDPHGRLSMEIEDPFWKVAPSVFLATNNFGDAEPEHVTEVRLRWTSEDLFLLYRCPYVDLHLRPGDPELTKPTAELWNHDVAEVFLGNAAGMPRSYQEYEVSPRGEWIDLEITCVADGVIEGRPLHSGFECWAELDASRRTWTASMRIPLRTFFTEGARTGDELRVNFFRSQGEGPVELAWQPTRRPSFHRPSCFGTLLLV